MYKSAYEWKLFFEDQTTLIKEITVVDVKKDIVSYFSVTGIKLQEEPEIGVYVVLFSDGTSKKMIK